MLKYELITKTSSGKQEFHFRNTSKEHVRCLLKDGYDRWTDRWTDDREAIPMCQPAFSLVTNELTLVNVKVFVCGLKQ